MRVGREIGETSWGPACGTGWRSGLSISHDGKADATPGPHPRRGRPGLGCRAVMGVRGPVVRRVVPGTSAGYNEQDSHNLVTGAAFRGRALQTSGPMPHHFQPDSARPSGPASRPLRRRFLRWGGGAFLLLLPVLLLTVPAEPRETEAVLPDPEAAWVDSVLASLSLEEKAGQLIMPWVMGDFAPEGSANHQRLVELVRDRKIGGFIVSVGTPSDVALKTNVFQRMADVPLLVAADLETGAGFRFRGAVHLPGLHDLGGATMLPSLMALGAARDRGLAWEAGRITALEARAVGVHVPFAPVLDVNSNPENPIINTRSLGEDPELVAELGACFVAGMQSHGGLATGKHFPGHGDTETDSHLALPVIRLGQDRLRAVELVPFQRAIDAGIQGIMTAHIALPGITEDDRLPATLSRNVMTGLLREEMGFQGLIFSDALDMNAIDQLYGREEAAVQAILAGVDVLLMPPDPSAAIRGVVGAVRDGRISESRLDASVRRILEAKARAGLHQERTVDAEAVHQVVGIPEHEALAREMAERSLVLLRNERDLLPLAGSPGASVLSVTYRRDNDLMAGRAFDRELGRTYRQVTSRTAGRSTGRSDYDALLADARGRDLVVVSAHVTAVSYSGSVAAPPELARFVQELGRIGVPHVVVSFGSPYLLAEFPDVRAYLLAWSGSGASQVAAARALLGQVPVQGTSPTRIPPRAEIGAGLSLGSARGPWSGVAGGGESRPGEGPPEACRGRL
ncbi:MAG: glycoside hydrolase family 3 protein [Gemmatimonadales bacterium]|nr:MAG: glycoside hydrolase family 3 protein [Gemmatimonadales bacterium]